MRIFIALAAALLVAACTPQPKNVPCSNDGDCAKQGEDFKYCLEARCVECLSSSSCEGGKCVDGRCEISCVNDRSCPARQVCQDGMCARL